MLGRLAAQEKKEKETGGSSLEQKQAEIDKLKAELLSVKNISVQEFRKLYEETGPEETGGAWKTKGGKGGKVGKGGKQTQAASYGYGNTFSSRCPSSAFGS